LQLSATFTRLHKFHNFNDVLRIFNNFVFLNIVEYIQSIPERIAY
jgi:hypothetical protein